MRTEQDCENIFLNSYAAYSYWKDDAQRQNLKAEISDAIQKCLNYNLIRYRDKNVPPAECRRGFLTPTESGFLTPTQLGKVIAIKGLSVQSTSEIISWAKDLGRRKPEDIEILYLACSIKDAADFYINMSTYEYKNIPYQKMLEDVGQGFSLAPINRSPTYEDIKIMKKAIILNHWISCESTIGIENTYNIHFQGL